MCGIVGLARVIGGRDDKLLLSLRDTMVHRGPDDAGLWWSPDGRVGLAHRRLAVIDLTPGGHQPFADESGRVTAVFNGTVYNFRELRRELEGRGHRFRTTSDTEVLVKAYLEWETQLLAHLRGMFAFGLYDSARRCLVLARDRAGEKPLYYRSTPGRLVFASELKALAADPSLPRELDLAALDNYLAYGFVGGEQCLLRGVNKLPPAHALAFDLESGKVQTWRYWQLPPPPKAPAGRVEAYEEELAALLENAVSSQLVADVPVGVLLSGGLDSSLVAVTAAAHSPHPVKTFTITLPGCATLDESRHARMVAEFIGAEHTELAAEPASVELLPELARQFDEPIADHAIVPVWLIAQIVRRSVKVGLSGDGGDELFGGYPHYRFLQRFHSRKPYWTAWARRGIGAIAKKLLPVGLPGRNHLIGLAGGAAAGLSMVNLYFDETTRRCLLTPLYEQGFCPSAAAEMTKSSLYNPEYTVVQNATRIDFQTTLPDDYLVKVDRASMRHSLELRAPFLDHRLIEFAFGCLPDHLRVDRRRLKVLLKRLGKRQLPAGLDLERKQGLTLPLPAWFKGRWGEYIHDVLSQADREILNHKVIAHLIRGQRFGLANANRLFALAMFELWRREYRVGLP